MNNYLTCFFFIMRQKKYSYFIIDLRVNNNQFVEENNKRSKITYLFTKGKGSTG